jgi:uncharacterized protein (TIRG00374 family)
VNWSKHWRIGLLGVVVSAVAIYFVAHEVDLPQVAQKLTSARYIFLLPCVAFLLAGLVTRALRWRVLLSAGLPLNRAFSIMNVAYLVNGVLPLRIGELARAYLASRAEPPVPLLKSASTIIVERLLDLLAVVVMMALALTAGPVPQEWRAAALLTAPMALIGVFFLIALARWRDLAHRIVAWWMARLLFLQRFDLRTWLDHFLDGLMPLTQPNALLKALFWTAVSWGLSLIAGYILMFAFYPRGDWAATALYISAAAFAIALPAMPANIGPYEGSIVLALHVMGYGDPVDAAISFALVVHGVNLAVHATTGILGVIQEGVSLGQLSQGVQRVSNEV